MHSLIISRLVNQTARYVLVYSSARYELAFSNIPRYLLLEGGSMMRTSSILSPMEGVSPLRQRLVKSTDRFAAINIHQATLFIAVINAYIQCYVMLYQSYQTFTMSKYHQNQQLKLNNSFECFTDQSILNTLLLLHFTHEYQNLSNNQ